MISLDLINDAYQALNGIAKKTPIERSRFLTRTLKETNNNFCGNVYIKCENLQTTGAYKIRGAYNKMRSLPNGSKVAAASAGNHAQGVAYAAKRLGLEATVFMPEGVSLPKLQATTNYGAKVVLKGSHFGQTLKYANDFIQKTGAYFIPPYDDIDVISGGGTIGIEILEQAENIGCVVIPVGGGGLISGIAAALKLTNPNIKVIGVQSQNASSMLASLEEGAPTKIKLKPTIADGIAVDKPGDITFKLVQRYVDEIITVNDDEIARAIVMLLERHKLVAEPAGAAAIAAINEKKIMPFADGTIDKNIIALLSGGNIDPLLLQQIIQYGLIELNRYTTISIMLLDKPGQLNIISEIIASQNANVVGVLHARGGRGLSLGRVELQLSIETNGKNHLDEVLAALKNEGYIAKIIR